eukprot:TRINITY_DN23981_c0_g1_i1.p1 TRINITY_DN23981_c0_g1~~TRINITY_DN23981_c0_g1_i1.p1  ORF type:complete len:128 (-),score=6.48 TRINITY_DN23981_c0_g1_i1:19-402(-)
MSILSEAESRKVEYKVEISHDGDEKYIVGRVTSPNCESVKLLLVSHALKYHSQIVEHVNQQLMASETLQVLGGGILRIDRQQRTIFTYGQSGGYGKPNKNTVQEILSNAADFADFTCTVTVTSYIRD